MNQQIFSGVTRKPLFPLVHVETEDEDQQLSEQAMLTPQNEEAQFELSSFAFRHQQQMMKTVQRGQVVNQMTPSEIHRQQLNPEESVPHMAVQDLSSYRHSEHQEINESTFMAMEVPQGPGSALHFLTEEPSTCFTPNFQSAESLQSLPTDGGMREMQDRETVDFDFVATEEHSMGTTMHNALQEQTNFQEYPSATYQQQNQFWQQQSVGSASCGRSSIAPSQFDSRYLVQTKSTANQIKSPLMVNACSQQQDEDSSMYPWLRASQDDLQVYGACKENQDPANLSGNRTTQTASDSIQSIEMTPDCPKQKLDSERDSILQFAPISVEKMSQRRNEIVGPNNERHQLYHSQLSQILSQHQAENTAFMNSQQATMQHNAELSAVEQSVKQMMMHQQQPILGGSPHKGALFNEVVNEQEELEHCQANGQQHLQSMASSRQSICSDNVFMQ